MKILSIPVDTSIGEVIDKISILVIKGRNITDTTKINNVRIEYEKLVAGLEKFISIDDQQVRSFLNQMVDINLIIWDIVAEIGELESQKLYNERFSQLARDVFVNNDLRARLKRTINDHYGSEIVEEKFYAGAQ